LCLWRRARLVLPLKIGCFGDCALVHFPWCGHLPRSRRLRRIAARSGSPPLGRSASGASRLGGIDGASTKIALKAREGRKARAPLAHSALIASGIEPGWRRRSCRSVHESLAPEADAKSMLVDYVRSMRRISWKMQDFLKMRHGSSDHMSAIACLVYVIMATVGLVGRAHAQGKVEARYTISVGLLTIGTIMVAADFGDRGYTISANGRTAGFIRVLSSGEGFYVTNGAINEGRLSPKRFTSNTTSGSEMFKVMMLLENWSVTELNVTPRGGERAPLTEAHSQGVIDPLSAMFVPAGETGGENSRLVCDRTLPVFDGYQRYDLKLSFKRMELANLTDDYNGPVVVCAVSHEPIAGHRISDTLIKFLSGREIEAVLAPIPAIGLWAPIRITVAGMLANLVIHANQFRTSR
jgi:Protein of unknown function (DUF3108)